MENFVRHNRITFMTYFNGIHSEMFVMKYSSLSCDKGMSVLVATKKNNSRVLPYAADSHGFCYYFYVWTINIRSLTCRSYFWSRYPGPGYRKTLTSLLQAGLKR